MAHLPQPQLASSTGMKINQEGHHVTTACKLNWAEDKSGRTSWTDGPMVKNQPPAQRHCSWHRSQRGVNEGNHQNKRRSCYCRVSNHHVARISSNTLLASQPDRDYKRVERQLRRHPMDHHASHRCCWYPRTCTVKTSALLLHKRLTHR